VTSTVWWLEAGPASSWRVRERGSRTRNCGPKEGENLIFHYSEKGHLIPVRKTDICFPERKEKKKRRGPKGKIPPATKVGGKRGKSPFNPQEKGYFDVGKGVANQGGRPDLTCPRGGGEKGGGKTPFGVLSLIPIERNLVSTLHRKKRKGGRKKGGGSILLLGRS